MDLSVTTEEIKSNNFVEFNESVHFEEDIYDAEEETLENLTPRLTIWGQIMEEYNKERTEIQLQMNKKEDGCDVEDNAVVSFMNHNIFNLLCPVLQDTIFQAIETDSLIKYHSTFNAIDYISQNLWNSNPKHPERKEQNLFIHDMEWAQAYLRDHPRPFFPLSWIYTDDIAATKIQAFMRGYWVRRRDDVQEMRQFWKEIIKEKLEENTWEEPRSTMY